MIYYLGMKSLVSERNTYDQPVKPYQDTSVPLYFSDGTVSTVNREQRLEQLQQARQRNLSADTERVAFWVSGLAIVRTVTPAEVAIDLDESLAQIDAEIQANIPTPPENT